MAIIEQINQNLVDPEKHGPILQALYEILEEKGEKGVKDQIKRWVEEIEEESSPAELEQGKQEGEG